MALRRRRSATDTESLPLAESRFARLAEREGFEPPVPFGTHDFQSCTFNRSVTAPTSALYIKVGAK